MIRNWILITLLCLSCAAIAAPSTLNWADLQPDDPALRARVAALNSAEKNRLIRAVQKRELEQAMKKDNVKPDALSEKDRQLLKEDLRDLSAFVDEIANFEKKRTSELKQALNQKEVRIDGYLLPLKQTDRKVTEFLLVPVIGACIHVPAPPPNQMIVVSYPQGYLQSGMFAPVTISGKLQVGTSRASLSLVDGSAMVEAGYRMQADDVRPYKRQDTKKQEVSQ